MNYGKKQTGSLKNFPTHSSFSLQRAIVTPGALGTTNVVIIAKVRYIV